jgi:hypothetical protein
MENIEKFEKNIKDEDIDGASESELADKFEGENARRERYQTEIKDALVDLFESSYFNIMDEIDSLEENISDDDFKKRFDFDIGKLKEYIDGTIPNMMGRINALSKKGEIFINSNNSVRDVLSNSLFGSLGTVLWFKKNAKSVENNILEKLNNPKSIRRESLDKARHLLESESLEHYFDELCSNEKRLKAEVELEHGYISKFSKFFEENERGKIYPSGSKKLPYFKFFSDLEDGNIGEEDLNRELDKLRDPKEPIEIKINENKLRREIAPHINFISRMRKGDINGGNMEEELSKLSDGILDKEKIILKFKSQDSK